MILSYLCSVPMWHVLSFHKTELLSSPPFSSLPFIIANLHDILVIWFTDSSDFFTETLIPKSDKHQATFLEYLRKCWWMWADLINMHIYIWCHQTNSSNPLRKQEQLWIRKHQHCLSSPFFMKSNCGSPPDDILDIRAELCHDKQITWMQSDVSNLR